MPEPPFDVLEEFEERGLLKVAFFDPETQGWKMTVHRAEKTYVLAVLRPFKMEIENRQYNRGDVIEMSENWQYLERVMSEMIEDGAPKEAFVVESALLIQESTRPGAQTPKLRGR